MRVEVMGRPERRRRWSREEKIRLVAETLAEGMTVKAVCERHGVAQSVLFHWRRQARLGLFSPVGAAFAPVAVMDAGERAATVHPAAAAHGEPSGVACTGSRIEIALGEGVRVVVGSDVDRGALERVLDALRASGR